jgi:hypothetical protein
MNTNLYTNGFLIVFKIYFYIIRSTRSRLLRRAVSESLLYVLGFEMLAVFKY